MRFILLLFFCVGQAVGQTPKQVVNDFLAATGGRQRWLDVISSKQTLLIWQNLDYLKVQPGVNDIISNIEPSSELRIQKLPRSLYTRNVNPKKDTMELFQSENGTGVVISGQY